MSKIKDYGIFGKWDIKVLTDSFRGSNKHYQSGDHYREIRFYLGAPNGMKSLVTNVMAEADYPRRDFYVYESEKTMFGNINPNKLEDILDRYIEIHEYNSKRRIDLLRMEGDVCAEFKRRLKK